MTDREPATVKERREAQELDRLRQLVGDRYAQEWLSLLREHCIPGHDAVPVWDALHLIMDIWRIARPPAADEIPESAFDPASPVTAAEFLRMNPVQKREAILERFYRAVRDAHEPGGQ